MTIMKRESKIITFCTITKMHIHHYLRLFVAGHNAGIGAASAGQGQKTKGEDTKSSQREIHMHLRQAEQIDKPTYPKNETISEDAELPRSPHHACDLLLSGFFIDCLAAYECTPHTSLITEFRRCRRTAAATTIILVVNNRVVECANTVRVNFQGGVLTNGDFWGIFA